MGVYLGIDTSAYTTSVAVCSEDGTLYSNDRTMLRVAQGERGLRQSEAFFQHVQNLPELLEANLSIYRNELAGVCVSSRPRPLQGSYMPVFTAGLSFGQAVASSLGIPLFETTHQEGHILAAAYGKDMDFSKPVICAHLSGGTLELVLVSRGSFGIVGGTRDISYGQLIDRTGVMLGFPFPSGKYMDKLAVEIAPERPQNPICRVFRDGTFISLSGVEDQLKSAKNDCTKEELAFFTLERIAESFREIALEAAEAHGAETVLVCGGVACSSFLREYCKDECFVFGRRDLCADNAAGVALTRGKDPWQ